MIQKQPDDIGARHLEAAGAHLVDTLFDAVDEPFGQTE
jgi:hypothetical protein